MSYQLHYGIQEHRLSPVREISASRGTLLIFNLSLLTGMFTVSDIIHLIQYYYQSTSYEGAAADVERFRLESIRGAFSGLYLLHLLMSVLAHSTDIEKVLHVPPPPLLSVHPMKPLFDACRLLIQTHARRLPLIDQDDQTGKEVVLSVLTQYRVLKFMAVNVSSPCQKAGRRS